MRRFDPGPRLQHFLLFPSGFNGLEEIFESSSIGLDGLKSASIGAEGGHRIVRCARNLVGPFTLHFKKTFLEFAHGLPLMFSNRVYVLIRCVVSWLVTDPAQFCGSRIGTCWSI